MTDFRAGYSSASSGFSAAPWRKSSYSNGADGACVEVAFAGEEIGVRDSADRSGGLLAFGAGCWCTFAAGVKAGRFDR